MRIPLRLHALIIAAVLAFAAPAPAQDSPVVALPLDWTVGERHKLVMTKEKARIRGGQQQNRGQAVTPVSLEVLQKSADGYVVRWTYGRTEFVGIKAGKLAVKLANIIENASLNLRVDPQGGVVGVDNVAEIARHYRKAGDALLDQMLKEGAPDDVLNKVSALLDKMGEPAAVEATAMREPQLYFLAFGGAYRMGERYEFEDRIPNPWGLQPFPTKATVFLQDVDADAGTATVGWKQVFDRDKAGPVLEATLRALGMQVQTDGDVFTGLSIADDALWVFDTKTGWMLSGSWQRAMTVDGNLVGVERVKFRAVE